MHKITPFLWFDNNAEDAMNFYVSLFPNSKITNISRLPEGAPGVTGQVLTASFELNGQEFMILNGGPQFQFNEAISLYVNCKDQAEVDDLWSKLTANGGEEGPCGWCKDRFGLSWQVIPEALGKLMGDPNPAKAQAAMQAMLQMKKIEVAKLEAAHAAA